MSTVAFECRSVGFTCEWALRAGSKAEVVERMREHARCAHGMSDLPSELVPKVEAAVHAA